MKDKKSLLKRVRQSIAIGHYKNLNLDVGLKKLGINPESISRPTGRPPKYILQSPIDPAEHRDGGKPFPAVIWRDEHIVQLVYKQKWQAGLPFSNQDGGDQNPCFYSVADKLGIGTKEVRNKWSRVPIQQRKAIERWLVKLLKEEKKIHPNKRKKAEKFTS